MTIAVPDFGVSVLENQAQLLQHSSKKQIQLNFLKCLHFHMDSAIILLIKRLKRRFIQNKCLAAEKER